MRKHNLAFIDIETTGLLVDKHEIIEIGVVVAHQTEWENKNPTLEIVEEFELKIKPERIGDADPVALKINKYDPADWVFAYNLEEAMKIFSQKTADCIMVSHNIAFDFSFIDKAFIKTKVENKMHFHKLDTISMAFAILKTNYDVDKFSLRYLCEYFGIKNQNAHTALSDTRATYEVYKKLMGM